MVKEKFDWDRSTWLVDYEAEFERVKLFIAGSTEKFFPDYNAVWILRVDASDYSCGAVLLQLLETEDGRTIHHPLGFKSYKFSDAASRWDIHKKEAYALYSGVKSFAYHLRFKPFILETDHANLLYMEKSEVPIVVRWRVYLQSFQHVLRKILGKHNTVADWASRLYSIPQEADLLALLEDEVEITPVVRKNPVEEDMVPPEAPATSIAGLPKRRELVPFPPWCQECGVPRSPEDYIRMVHNTTMLHNGARRTWQALGKYFPGHRIPYSRVAAFVRDCPRCQKDARRMVADIQPYSCGNPSTQPLSGWHRSSISDSPRPVWTLCLYCYCKPTHEVVFYHCSQRLHSVISG